MDFLSPNEIIISWVLAILTIVGFGIFAIYTSRTYRRQEVEGDEVDFFLTARNSQPTLRVAWSFLAGFLGAWIITSPASNVSRSGIIGMVAYAFWSGMPILLVALFGIKVQEILPSVLGFCDYARSRFGFVVQIYVTIIILFNMGVALTVEYTSISEIFNTITGNGSGIIIVSVIGVVTMLYTAFGGLFISILTDQYQAILGSTLIGVIVLILSIMFRPTLPNLPTEIGINENGLSSLITLPISLFCATVFMESPWQRALASESPKALKTGAILASLGVGFIVLIFGIMGLLASWAGLVTDDNMNSIVFVLMIKSGSPTWVIIIILILAVTMCESAVDTAQNGLVNTVSSLFLRGKPILWSRLAVLLLNIPPMIISQLNFNIYDMFMIGNKITTFSAIPLLLGLWPWSYKYITGPSVLFGGLTSMLSLIFYGCIAYDFSITSIYTAFVDPYSVATFVIPFGFSLVGLGIWISISQIIHRFGYSTPVLPGFQIDTQFQTPPDHLIVN